jgi:hypothetical protein
MERVFRGHCSSGGQAGMNERADEGVLRDLAVRLAALEDNVAFLEVWCEEQQDALDRVGEAVYFYGLEEDEYEEPPERARLYVVDGRDPEGPEESEHQRKVRQLRARINRLRTGLGPGAVVGTCD